MNKFDQDIIEISISEFVNHFETFEKCNNEINENEIKIDFNKEEQISFEVKFTGLIRVKVTQNRPFPMKVSFLPPYSSHLFQTKHQFNGEEEKELKRIFFSKYGKYNSFDVVIDASPNDVNSTNSVTISIENNNTVEISDYERRYLFKEIENDNPENYHKCIFCLNKFNNMKEIYNLNFKRRYCHISCYLYTKCCCCKRKFYYTKKILQSKMSKLYYDDELNDYICDDCFEETIEKKTKPFYSLRPHLYSSNKNIPSFFEE